MEGSSPEDRLRRLEQRLGEASDAAERLFAEAASHASGETHGRASEEAQEGRARQEGAGGGESGSGGPPPAGWQIPGAREPRSSRSELELLVQMFQSVRDLIPPELQRRLADALRELLLALRALIDWYLERSEQHRQESSQVEDIPIL